MKLVPRFNFTENITPVVGLRKLQDNILPQVNQVLGLPIVDGRLLTVNLTASTTKVEHGLGRKFVGWIVVDVTDFAVVTRDGGLSVDETLFLPLVATTAVTAKIWVF